MVARSRSGLVESDANVLAGRRPVDGLNDQAVLVDQNVPAGYKLGTLKNKKKIVVWLSILGEPNDKVLVKTGMNIKCLVLLYSI